MNEDFLFKRISHNTIYLPSDVYLLKFNCHKAAFQFYREVYYDFASHGSYISPLKNHLILLQLWCLCFTAVH